MYQGGSSLYTPVLDVPITVSRRCRQLNATRLPAVNQALISALAELPEIDFSLEEETIAAYDEFNKKQVAQQVAEQERIKREQVEIQRRAPGLDSSGRILEPLRTSLAAQQLTMTTSSNGNMILSEEDLKVLEKDIISVANSKSSISMARPVTPVTIVDAPLQVPTIPSSSLSHLLNGTSVTSHPTAMSNPSNSNNNTIPLLNEIHSSHASPSIHPIEDSLSHQFTSISIATINNTPVNTSSAMSIPIEYMNTPPAQSFASPSSSLMSTTLLSSKYGQSPSSIPTINSTITNSSNPCTTNNTISSDVQRHLLEKSSWNATSIPSLMTRSTSEELPSIPSSHFTTTATATSTNTSINEQSTQHSFHLNRYGHRQSLSAHTSPTIDPFAPLEYRSMVDHGNTETTRFNPLQYFHEQSHNELISTSKPSLPSSITTDPNDNYSLSSLPPTALLSNHTVIDDIPYYFPDATHE